MSRAALLLVVGEAFTDKQKTLILDKIAEDLQSWDDEGSRCDLEKELENFSAEMKSFGDVAVSGTALSHSSDGLSLSILFSPDRKLLLDSLQNFLLLDSHYRHLVYAGQTIVGSGSWILPDDVFTFRNFVKVLKDMDSVGVGGDGKGFSLSVSSTSEWDWSKGNFSRLSNLGVRLAGPSEKGRNFEGFRALLDPLLAVIDMGDVLKASSTVGMINFSGPTLYVFPGGNGSSALFGVKGFTGLVDGGYSRKSCSWHFSRHLHQIDMVILSHLGASNFLGMQSFLERKIETGSPDVGSVFFNCPERFRKLSPNPESLKVNLFDAGAALSEKLAAVGLAPQPCFAPQPFQPITLYNKVGFGSVDMYILNPVQSSEELKSFLHQWSMRAESEAFSAHSGVPQSSALSVSVLLVWKPFAPTAKIIRILFPGGTPQAKIFEGLDRLKNIPVFERSECSQAELSAKPARAAQGRPTTLKPMAAKANGNLDHRETAKTKAMNGSKDSVVGKAKPEAREPVLAKTSAIQRSTKVEPKKTDTSPTNGTGTPKSDPKPTSKPVSPSKSAKDVKTTTSRNVETLPPKRVAAQKPHEVEAPAKNKTTKAPQPEAAKQTKPARRTEELKTSEVVKQSPASKQSNVAKEPATKPLNIARDTKPPRHSEPTKQTKAVSNAETLKPGTPKSAKVSKEADKNMAKWAEPKRIRKPEAEKKDQEKEPKEEAALIQPAEVAQLARTPETGGIGEPVEVTATAVELTSAIPPEASPIVADGVLGNGEAATKAVDYDLPSPEDVAQMSQEDEDSFVEELPTETELGYVDQKERDSGIVQTTDPDVIANHELRDDVVLNKQVVRDFDDEVNEVEGSGDLVYRREIPENLQSGEFSNGVVAGLEVVEDKIDAELEEDLEFERDEKAVQILNDSIEEANDVENLDSAELSDVQDPGVRPDHDISGVCELVADESVETVDDGKEKEDDDEDLIIQDHEDVVHPAAALDRDSEHDQDVAEHAAIEGSEKEDLEKPDDVEEHSDLEREHLEDDRVEKDLLDDLERRDVDKNEPNSWLLQDSRFSGEHGALQGKRATDGLARYCEEFGSDEGELDEEQQFGEKLKKDDVTCSGGIQGQGKTVEEEEEEEDEADELEAVREEDEVEEEERIGIEERTVPDIGCEVDVVLSGDVTANGGCLPDVLGHEDYFGKEDEEAVEAVVSAACLSSPVAKVQEERTEELGADEGFDGDDDFSKGGVGQSFGIGEEDLDRVEQDLGRSDDLEKVGDLGRGEDDSEEERTNDDEEEGGRAGDDRVLPDADGKDDNASDVDLLENKGELFAGDRIGGGLSDNEAVEAESGAGPLESAEDVLPCALKKDTAIENLAAICAETKEGSSDIVESLSSRALLVGEARPDLVPECESLEPRDVETAIETDDEDKESTEGPDVVGAEGMDGSPHRFEVEEPHNLSLDEGISQGKPHDLHLFNAEDEEEQPSSCSWKLDDMAANLAHEVIQSSLAAQNLEASACFASGPVSVAPLNGTEKPEIEADESYPQAVEDVKDLVNTTVETVATSDSTSSGLFNYGFDDFRREEASAADSFDGASAVVQPARQYKEKTGEDSGESDLDDGQDACHQGQHGLVLGNEPEDGSRLDEGFEESTGDESPANVTELMQPRTEDKTAKSLSRAEDSEGTCAFAYGASGEVADEEQEEPFGSAGGPASEKTTDSSRPLLDFDSDVSATHPVEFGNGHVEGHRNAMDAWQRNDLNPFLDPCSVEAEDKESADLFIVGSGAGCCGSLRMPSGKDLEDFDHKLEGDEQSIPSDDNAEPEPVLPAGHEQDMVQSSDERGSDDLKVTPEDETAEIPARTEENAQEDVMEANTTEETAACNRTTSFLTIDDNIQTVQPIRVHGAADNILFSEETTGDVQRDINENLGVATGPEEADDEDLEEDLEKVSTQSNASEEGESRSSAVLSEQHEGAESLDSDVDEVDPVKSWGKPMGLPAPALDSNRSKVKTASRLNNDAANLTLPASTHDRKSAAKTNDRSFVAPQKKGSDVRKSAGPLKTAAEPGESKENGSIKTTITKKPVATAAQVAKKQTTTSTDASKSKPLKHVVPFYVDLTYIPGNGDPSYVDADFFRRVRARYYVLSSLDPDPRILSFLVEGKQTWENKDLSVNVIPTHDSSALHRWFHDNAKLVEELKISLLPAANKCTIKLQDKDDGCYAFRIEF